MDTQTLEMAVDKLMNDGLLDKVIKEYTRQNYYNEGAKYLSYFLGWLYNHQMSIANGRGGNVGSLSSGSSSASPKALSDN